MMIKNILMVVALIISGCAVSSEKEPKHKNVEIYWEYGGGISESGKISYYIDGEFVGVGSNGVVSVVSLFEQLPEGGNVVCVIKHDITTFSGTVLNGKRGSSASVADICTFPVRERRLSELVTEKNLNVTKKRIND